MAADDAHHQPRAGAGVAEVERLARRQDRAEAGPANPPSAWPEPLDCGAERLAGLSGPEHVVALEQPLDLRFAAGQEAKQEGAMRDRLVARRPDPALERSRAHGAERRRCGRMRRMSGHEAASFPPRAKMAARGPRPALLSPPFDPVDRREKRIDTTGSGD